MTAENKSSQLAVRGIPKPWGIQSTSLAVQKGIHYVCTILPEVIHAVYVSTARVVIKLLQSVFWSKLFCSSSPFPRIILHIVSLCSLIVISISTLPGQKRELGSRVKTCSSQTTVSLHNVI